MRSFLRQVVQTPTFAALWACCCAVAPAFGDTLPGVRAKSFGGAYRAVAKANDIIYYNPAGIIAFPRAGVDADYLSYVDGNFHQIGATVVDSSTTSWGMGLAYNMDIHPNRERKTGHFLDAAIAIPIVKDMFSIGTSLYYTYNADPLDEDHRHFFNMDAGVLATLPIGLSFALVIDHIVKPKGKEKGLGLSLASAFDLGVLLPAAPLSISFDWIMNDVTSKESLGHVISAGGEFILFGVLPLRLGLQSTLKDSDNLISLGSGFMMNHFALDGLYQQHLTIGKIRNFGLAARFYF